MLGVEEEVRHRVASEKKLCVCLAPHCPVDPAESAQIYPLSLDARPLHDDLHSSCLWRTSAAA